jgi:hypothetical protein
MKPFHISNFISLIYVLMLPLGCTTVDKPDSYEEDLAVINKFLESSGEAVTRGDVEAEVHRFTKDGIYMWPDAPSIVGHDSLTTWFRRRFEKVSVNIDNVTEELQI